MANKKNRIIASSVTAALVASAIAPVAGAAFTDSIPAYAQKAVEYVKDKGIMKGVSATEFAANKTISRAEVAVVIANALGLETEGKKADFSDVKENHWASAQIAAVVEAGIAEGKGNGTFDPAGEITRQEAAKMFANAYSELKLNDKAEVSFADENTIADWAKEKVEILASLGIMTGKQGGVFAPKAEITRGEIAVLVHRILEESVREEVPTKEVATVESITSIDSTTLEVILDGEVTEVSAEDFKFDGGLEVLKAEIKTAVTKEAATKTTVILTTSEQKEGTTYKLVSYKGEEPSTEIKVEKLVVKSVSATTTMIEKATSQQLKFTVNGEKELTIDQLKTAGYTVKFLFNKTTGSTYNATTGVVNGLSADETFKYAVEITPTEGDAITSAWVDVKVVDVEEIVKVTKIELSNESTYINQNETGVKILVKEVVTAGGKTLTEDFVAPEIKSIISTDETVLYTNASNELVARKTGKVTLTVEFEDIKEKVTLDVEVKAAQEAKSITEATTKVALKTSTIKFTTLDADGKKLVAPKDTTSLKVTVTDSEGSKVEDINGTVAEFETGKLASSISKEGKYTIEVTADSKKIGSYTLEVVDTENATADEYKILTTDGKNNVTLDINPGENTANTTKVTVSDYVNGIALGSTLDISSDSTTFEVKSSNTKVVEISTEDRSNDITLTAGEETGTATITLYTVAGDYKVAVATFEVTVKNTTPQVTSLVLKDSKSPIVLNESWIADQSGKKNEILTAIATGVQSNLETFSKDMIESFEITSQGTVIVTIKAANGGKEFALAFESNDDVAPTFEDASYDSEAGTITFTFSEAVKLADEDISTLVTVSENDSETLGEDATIEVKDNKVIITLGEDAKFAIGDTVTLVKEHLTDLSDVVLTDDAEFTFEVAVPAV